LSSRVVGVRLAAYLVDLIFPVVGAVLAVFAQARVCLLRRERTTQSRLAQVEQAALLPQEQAAQTLFLAPLRLMEVVALAIEPRLQMD
jgi:hypothetical protein